MRQLLPEPLAVERILTDQHVTHEAVDQVRPHHLGRAEAMPLGAVVGGDGQQRLLHAMRIAGMRVPVAVPHLLRDVWKNTRTLMSTIFIPSSSCPPSGICPQHRTTGQSGERPGHRQPEIS